MGRKKRRNGDRGAKGDIGGGRGRGRGRGRQRVRKSQRQMERGKGREILREIRNRSWLSNTVQIESMVCSIEGQTTSVNRYT